MCHYCNYKTNLPALVRACENSNLDTVLEFYRAGFRITTQLAIECHQILNEDMMKELTYLGATASPAYLLAKYQCEPDSYDPVKHAMELIRVCTMLKKSMKSMSERITIIKTSLEDFAVKLLELCPGTTEAKLFLDQIDDPDDIDITRTMLPPRINFALKLRFKKFVLHDYCQLLARDVIYGKDMCSINSSGFFSSQLQHALVSILRLPFACLYHSFSKLYYCSSQGREQQYPCDFGKTLHTPINRLYNYAAAYLFFLAIVILNLVNPNDEKGRLDWAWYNYANIPLSIGFLGFDIKQMSILSSSVRIWENMSKVEAAFAKFCGLFGNRYLTYRFVGHAMYVMGMATEYLGYKYQKEIGNAGFRYLQLNTTHLNLNYTVEVDDRESHFVSFHPVRIGICSQGIALMIVMTHILQYLCLHPVLGMVYVGLRNENAFS